MHGSGLVANTQLPSYWHTFRPYKVLARTYRSHSVDRNYRYDHRSDDDHVTLLGILLLRTVAVAFHCQRTRTVLVRSLTTLRHSCCAAIRRGKSRIQPQPTRHQPLPPAPYRQLRHRPDANQQYPPPRPRSARDPGG